MFDRSSSLGAGDSLGEGRKLSQPAAREEGRNGEVCVFKSVGENPV
jgi:hypothetical protein